MSIPRDNYVGEPNYPAPWTTKQPFEGLRDVDAARIVSLSPDVCLTPVGSSVVPIPYPVVDYCGHDRNYTPSVRFTGQKAMVLRSCTTHVHGDAPGTRKGVKSGTVESICEPIGHAAQVRAEGSNVIRHLDRFWMNNKNTQGEAIFVRDMETYQAPAIGDPVPGSLRSQPILLAQANTGTMTDAGGILFSPGTSTVGGQTRAPAPSIPNSQLPSAGQVARGLLLRRLGIYGIAAEELIRELNLPSEQRAAENRALGVILSPAGDTIMTQNKLLGGRQPVTFSNILDANTWDFSGKYGLVIDADERVPLANDILSSIAGKPMDVRTMSDAQVKGLLSPFQGLSDKDIEQKLKDMTEARQREEKEKKEEPDPTPKPVPLPDNVRIKERDKYRKKCQVDTYNVMAPICRQYGMQAHHIVPDWTLRYGTREEGMAGVKRIKNMPDFWKGQSICVMGQARVSGTEHNQGHAADDAIESLGRNSTPPYTTRLENVKRESIKAMVKVRPDCVRQILEAVNREFMGTNANQLVRAKQYPPLPQPTLDALSSGAISGANSKQ